MASPSPPNVDLCALPAAVSPDGTYDLIDPPSLQGVMYGLVCPVTAVTALLVIGRIWLNWKKMKPTDYVIILAAILQSGNLASCLARFSAGSAKIAILLLYLDVFAVQRQIRWAIYTGIAFAFGLYITYIPCSIYFLAPHVGESWMDMTANGRSNKAVPWAVTIAANAILLDCYVFILPIPIIWKLRLSRSKRWQLACVFGTALFGVAASIVAFAWRLPLLEPGNDLTWRVGQTDIASLIECDVALCVACAPAWASFYGKSNAPTRLWRRLISSKSWSGKEASGGISNENFAPMAPGHDLENQVNGKSKGQELDSLNSASAQSNETRPLARSASVIGTSPFARHCPGITKTVDITVQQEHQGGVGGRGG